MLTTFCLRLATGLIAILLVLSPTQVPPRFFRVQYLISLGLLVVAAFFLHDHLWLNVGLGTSLLFCFVGSIIWHVEDAPFARPVLVLATLSLLITLVTVAQVRGIPEIDPTNNLAIPDLFRRSTPGQQMALAMADHLTSAALLGSSLSAMLMGHSYLISPAMALAPLMRLLAVLGISLLFRLFLAGSGLWWWTGQATAANLETETLLWLSVRRLLGFVGPMILGWMAWETARIRSTQSATGILYVVVIVCFLGELTSQLLLEKTGHVL